MFIIVNPLLDQPFGHLSGSFVFVASLCFFIILVALWDQDFWRTFRNKLSALKKRFFYADQKHTLSLIPKLPRSQEALQGPSGELPSVGDIAELLVKALPASNRSEAYTLLVAELLPKKLAQLPTFLEPLDKIEGIYSEIYDDLQQTRPNQRLQLLRADLCKTEIILLSLDSVMLAIACYMHQYPDATPDTQMYWLDLEELSKWSALDIGDLENEALQRLEELEQWEKLVKSDFPEIWQEQYLEHLKVLLNLRAAYYGEFHTGMGELALFLDAVGASFEEIRLCH